MFINKVIDYLGKVIPIIHILEQPMNIRNFKEKLDVIINRENSTKIITYLKLTNRDINFNTYNKRFRIYVNAHNVGQSKDEDKTNMIMIKYNTDNYSYYNPDNVGEISQEVKDIEVGKNKNIQNNGKFKVVDGKRIDVNKYESTYLFGKFMKLFLPNLNNKNIADEMTVIQEQAESGKPIFMLGYGASGAGKTSSLIYFNKGNGPLEKQGILIHLCNIFGERGYESLEVTSKEFFMSKIKTKNVAPLCSGDNTIKNPTICNTNLFSYSFQGGEFKLTKNYEYNNIHKYRSKRTDDAKHPFMAGNSLGETMIYLIDTDRFVKATTNNPNSSRSHILVFVKLKKSGKVTLRPEDKDDKIINIIVGDFAGVENRFQCTKPDVISRFLKINRDDGSGIPYYSSEPMMVDGKLNMDPIDGGAPAQETDGAPAQETEEECDPEYVKIQDPIYDFQKPIYRVDYEVSKMIKFGEFTNENGSNYKKLYQESVLRNMFTKMILPGSDLKDLNSNELTYKYISTGTNIKIIEKNYKRCVEELNTFMEPLETVMRRFLFKMLLGTNEEGFENYKNEMNSLSLSMKGLLQRATASGATGPKSYSYSEAQHGEPNSGDGLASFKPSGSKSDQGFDSKKFAEEQKMFVGSYQKADVYINNFIDEIVNGKSAAPPPPAKGNATTKGKKKGGSNNKTKKRKYDIQEGGGSSYSFYAKDPNNDAVPIKKTYESTAISKILFESGNYFGKIKDYLGFLNMKYDPTYFQKLNGDKNDDYTAVLTKAREMFDKLWIILKETKCRVEYGANICESRATEGDFINDSLREIRYTIKEMLIEKNKNVLYNSPEYIDACLETYCPSYENCFELQGVKIDPKLIPSAIFREIMTYLNANGKNYESKFKFYEEIVVSVFCVFNISRQANNPPSTPYLDINRMKQIFFYEKMYNIEKRQEFIKLFYELKEKIKSEFSDKVGNLLEIKKSEKDPMSVFEVMDKYITSLNQQQGTYKPEMSEE
jgi:hypothetical protein